MTSNTENPHLGTTLDDFLAEDGLLDGANRAAASRVSAWQSDEHHRSLWQVAQSGYDVFVFQDDGPLARVTDANAGTLGVYATGRDSDGDACGVELGKTYLNFEPRRASDFYVVHSVASNPAHRPQELCVNRCGAGGDTVYVNGFGYLFCGSHEAGHAVRLGGVGDVYREHGYGHAIRYDGDQRLPSGGCYDLIRHHLGRIAHIAQVGPDAPSFDPGYGDVRGSEHGGVAFRAGDGPGTVRGEGCQDDRPTRGRRRLPVSHARSSSR